MTKILAYIMIALSCWSGPVLSYSPYSNKELDELEKDFIQEINQSPAVLRNPLGNQYINHLGKTLAVHSQQPVPYFFIVKSNEINAFAGPGGYIGVNSQLILATDNESELAGVMAHEMAHVRLHHLYRMFEHQKQMRVPMLASMLAAIALGAVNPTLGSGALMASITGFAQDNINFTRSSEKEADRIGINMLIKAGFNPQGMADFFKKMQQTSRYYYRDNIPAILRSHPLDEDRIAEAENRSAHLPKKSYTDSLDYRLFKELVRASTWENTQLLNYYQQECRKKNLEIVCQYGKALTFLKLYKYTEAQNTLLSVPENNSNLFFSIALVQAEMGLKHYPQALQKLEELHVNFPENYAVNFTYGQTLLEAGKPEQAANLLLKASRLYKNDLPICEKLAQAQAASHRKDYAYFTQAQCELLQGRARSAMGQLKLAKKFALKDQLLQQRIDAKMEEVKYLSAD